MTLTEQIVKLVETCKIYNKLDDAICVLSGSGLDYSIYGPLYTNYEETVLEIVLNATGHSNDKNIIKFFSAIILDLAQNGKSIVVIDGKPKVLTIDSIVPALMLMEDYIESYS